MVRTFGGSGHAVCHENAFLIEKHPWNLMRLIPSEGNEYAAVREPGRFPELRELPEGFLFERRLKTPPCIPAVIPSVFLAAYKED